MMVSILRAQGTITGSWTWVKGSEQVNDSGSYGQLGQPSATNYPRSRSGALTWTDSEGITWMFGGSTFCEFRCGPLTLGDLWTYDPSSNNWTWIAGPENPDQNIAAVYGNQGIPSQGNNPGSRTGCFTWIPGDGKFWFYDPSASEIWNYNPSTSEWTWMNGKPSPPKGVREQVPPHKPEIPMIIRPGKSFQPGAGRIPRGFGTVGTI